MNRLEAIKNIREKLRNGGHSIGSWIQIPHSSIAEIMGDAGYDWVAVDMEHGSVSVHQLPDLFRALELGDTLPLARLAQGEIKECKQALDAGAGGVIVPMVESSEQLEKISDMIRWPPAGKRGVACSRANLFCKHFDAYIEEAQQPLMVAMIEHINAVENLDAILKVRELDAILIGPYDLSASMGLTGQFEDQTFRQAIGQVLEGSRKYNVPAGFHAVQPDPTELRSRIDEGYQFFAYSIDSVLLNHSCPNPFKE